MNSVRWSGALLAVLAAEGCARGGAGPPPLPFEATRPAGRIEGAWVGGTDALGGWTLIEIDVLPTATGLRGELRAPSENVTRLPLSDVEVSGGEVRFSFHSPLGAHRAEGRWDGGMVFGRIEGGGLSGRFHLLPVAPPENAPSRWAGSYAERPGHRLLVTPRAGGGLAWAETEPLDDGALWIAGGALYRFAGDNVFTDRSIRAEPRLHEWAARRPDGALEWHPETRPVRVTPPVSTGVGQEAARFRNGAVELAGTLLLPVGDGPHPAVAVVHGSGPAERTHLLSLLRADLLLRLGVAVLLWDKRGVGGSSGDWERAGIEALAGDAAAALRWLRAHPAVAPGSVGLFGHSQAGWVIPAAARRADPDFLVVLSGGGVTPAEQEAFRARAEAAAAGLSAEDAATLMELKWHYAATGEGWSAYRAAAGAADPRVAALVETPSDPDPAAWALVRALAGYDPAPDLAAIRVPTLLVLGSDDDNVPAGRVAEAWRAAVRESLLTVVTVEGAGHALVAVREGVGSVFPSSLVTAVSDWVRARLRLPPSPVGSGVVGLAPSGAGLYSSGPGP